MSPYRNEQLIPAPLTVYSADRPRWNEKNNGMTRDEINCVLGIQLHLLSQISHAS